MSYLQLPRLNFAGQFQADPSTVNNDPEHFDTKNFQSDYDLLQNGDNFNGWWNPTGSGAWNFYNCTVQSVTYKDGTTCDDPFIDPIIGTPVYGANARVAGKIVDLDPDQQMVSQLWGFQVNLGANQEDQIKGLGFKSDFKTAPFADISFSRCPSAPDDTKGSAFYQSVLKIIKNEWSNGLKSQFISEISTGDKKHPLPADELSIKFTVDSYIMDNTKPNFAYGRISGSIGICNDNEPDRFIAGRVLAQANGSPLNTAYAIVQDKSLIIDLGNTFPISSVSGPFIDQGKLYAAIMDPSTNNYNVIGQIRYLEEGWYFNTAGIVSISMTEEQVTLSHNNPLVIIQAPVSVLSTVLLSESSLGTFVRADDFVFRMNPGELKKATFFATQFGRPYPNQLITLGYSIDPQIQDSANLPNGYPQSAFTFPTSITTNNQGQAELVMTAGNPGNPRGYIDGQVYGITYALSNTAPPYGAVTNPSQLISALVFDEYEIPDKPNWIQHIQPIFQLYANLYPVMRHIVDLSDYASVVSKRYILQNVFNEDNMENPNYMPVTRDLSNAKRKMIQKWLNASDGPNSQSMLYMPETKDGLLLALQLAIELEHATIPPYLCALYSIKSGVNTEVSALIRSVVLEEMLHMTLVCNILVSIGGSPNIGHPQFIPSYPCSLPGGLRQGLIVSLKKCSIEHIRECFMSIEEPDYLIIQKREQSRTKPFGKTKVEEKTDALALTNNQNDSSQRDTTHPQDFTIGWFYKQIKSLLEKLSKENDDSCNKVTFGNTKNQVDKWRGEGNSLIISCIDDALNAIDEIMEQGEGTSSGDPYDNDPENVDIDIIMEPAIIKTDEERELAHYFKFGEIVAGKHYVGGDNKEIDGYPYTGAKIAFNQDGVWPMMDNPYNVSYPQGSKAQILDNQFSETYKALLNGLHKTFTEDPLAIREAIGSMFSLEVIGRKLMEVELGDGTNAGPTFQTNVTYL